MEYYIRLKEVREKNHKTQKEVASVLGTSQQAYLKYEKGKTEMPVGKLIKLCRYYNVSADYLLGLADEDKKLVQE